MTQDRAQWSSRLLPLYGFVTLPKFQQKSPLLMLIVLNRKTCLIGSTAAEHDKPVVCKFYNTNLEFPSLHRQI
jgi:hypothetical protein